MCCKCGWLCARTGGYLKKVMGMQPFRMALKSRVVSCVAPGAHTQKRDLAMSASVSCTGNRYSSGRQQQKWAVKERLMRQEAQSQELSPQAVAALTTFTSMWYSYRICVACAGVHSAPWLPGKATA